MKKWKEIEKNERMKKVRLKEIERDKRSIQRDKYRREKRSKERIKRNRRIIHE